MNNNATQLPEKLRFLEGILGAELPSLYFVSQFQAKRLGLSKSQFSKKLNGHQKTHDSDLACFIDLFKLGPSLDYRLFYLPLDQFEEALRTARIGTYGGQVARRYRKHLLDSANLTNCVSIVRLGNSRLAKRGAGGIGAVSEHSELTVLRPFDEIALRIALPEECRSGHLMLLNDDITANQISVLMPSKFARDTRISQSHLRLPCENDKLYFPVSMETGFFRIYVIWSQTPLAPVLEIPPDAQNYVHSFDGDELANLVRYLSGTDVKHGVRIGFCDYIVES